MASNILFLGGSSLLAHCWIENIASDSVVYLGLHNRLPELNSFKEIKFESFTEDDLFEKITPLNLDLIINCIGYTNVENCEINFARAEDINAKIAANIAKVSNALNIKLVHISTDQLFDGSVGDYDEESPVVPLNNYAITKSLGEKLVFRFNSNALVIRTNFFGWGPSFKHSFSDYIITRLESKKRVSLFSDVFYNPILVSELADAVMHLVSKGCGGIFNVVSSDTVSKLEFGFLLAEEFGLDSSLIDASRIVSRKELVRRPLNMTLSSNKLRREGVKVASLKEQIRKLKIQRTNRNTSNQGRTIIPYGRQNISEKDINAVTDVLRSDYLTQGPVSIHFEKALANFTKSKFGVSVSSATAALHIACIALDLSSKDIVWTSPITFVASANCAVYCGAQVDFVDIDKETYNISVKELRKKLEAARANDKLPKILIPVHLSGQSCDMREIYRLSIEFGFQIIEDASHAIGGKYEGEPIGNCKYSTITVFSFHPVKIITTGEGGMCTTNDPIIAKRLCSLRSHGITRYPKEMTKKPDGPWYYEQIELGFNYRMNDISAALGLSQLDNIDEFVEKRHAIAQKYNEAFKDKPLILPYQHKDCYSSYHLYIIRVENSIKGLNKLDLFNSLRDSGILVNLHYIPVYRQPYYQKMNYSIEDFPESEKYYEEALSLPIHPLLKEEEQDFIIESVINFLSRQKTYLKNYVKEDPKGFQTIF